MSIGHQTGSLIEPGGSKLPLRNRVPGEQGFNVGTSEQGFKVATLRKRGNSQPSLQNGRLNSFSNELVFSIFEYKPKIAKNGPTNIIPRCGEREIVQSRGEGTTS